MAVLTPVTPGGAPVEPDREAQSLVRHWGLFVVSGVIGLVVGVLVLVYPSPSLKLLGVFLGVDLLLVGILLIMRGISSDGEPGEGPGAILLGALGVIAGVLVIRNPGATIALIVLAFAIWMIVAGAIALGHAIVHRERRVANTVRGAALVVFGTLIVSWPDMSLKTLALLTGLSLVVQGVVEIAEGLALRSLKKSAE